MTATDLQEIGYDCVQWSVPIYADLLRWGDGTGQGLIKAYFSRLGWPTMLSTKDRPVRDCLNKLCVNPAAYPRRWMPLLEVFPLAAF